jgi:hypothetical protein
MRSSLSIILNLLSSGVLLFGSPVGTATATDHLPDPLIESKLKLSESYGNLPLYFIQNQGQINEQVRFYEKGSWHTTFFTQEGVYFSLTRDQKKADIAKLTFQGGDPKPEVIAEGIQGGKANYLIGRDPGKWRTQIPTYQAVIYQEIYPGIDIKFYGNNRQMEYDILVEPKADPSKIALAYEGIENLRVTETGDLEIVLKEGNILQKRPVVYQEIGGKKISVAGDFKIRSTPINLPGVFVYGFDIALYDKNHPLIIDPTLIYSTYLGGHTLDHGYDIAVDDAGNAYVTGITFSSDFPTTPGGFDPVFEGPQSDVFVAKLNSFGNDLIYSTYLGGSDDDEGYGIALDSFGNAYVTGTTFSPDFPTTPSAYDTSCGTDMDGLCNPDIWPMSDVFFTLINPSGDGLVCSTFLGGSLDDHGSSIATDGSGNAYITGWTRSSDYPAAPDSPGPIQPFLGGDADAFVTKINSTCSSLVYSTYLGGSQPDSGEDIVLDLSNNAYVTGGTASSDFPTLVPLQGFGGIEDAFVTQIDSDGTAILYSTFLGGTGPDSGQNIALDTSANAYVTGYTGSSMTFPLVNPYQSVFGSGLDGLYDAFVTKIDSGGMSLLYSTFLGGGANDFGRGIAVDIGGNAYVTGGTDSPDFPTLDPVQTALSGSNDLFVTKITAPGTALGYSTFLGGSGSDVARGVALDTAGNVYLIGTTGSNNFPALSALQPAYAGGADAFVLKISEHPRLTNISTRAFVGTGSQVEIGGFIISGATPKQVLIRGFGPTLANFGVTGAMADPRMTLYSGGTVIASNDNYQTPVSPCNAPAISCGTPQEIEDTGKAACTIAPGPNCGKDAALLVTLPPGTYTVHLSGVGGGTGVGLIGVDDLHLDPTARLVNISTRALVQTDNKVMIGGFVIGAGVGEKKVLIRAFGPTLANFGITGYLANPVLELYSGSTLLAANDDWQTPVSSCHPLILSCGTPQDIEDTGKDACTVAPGPNCGKDAALLVTLPPGAYTAVVRGVNNGTGVGLVGVDEASP